MDWLKTCKRIVKENQNEKFKGVVIDSFTASAIVQVANYLEQNRPDLFLKFKSGSLDKAITISFKLMNKG